MTTFEDGPAKGQRLMLHRAPIFLRVTEKGGKFDALDQVDDTPRPDEMLYAYQLAERPGHCHINTGRKPGGGFYPVAKYRMIVPQPLLEEMLTREAWVKWVERNKEKAIVKP